MRCFLCHCDVRTIRTTRTGCAAGRVTSAVAVAVESCVLTRLRCEMHLDEAQGTAAGAGPHGWRAVVACRTVVP